LGQRRGSPNGKSRTKGETVNTPSKVAPMTGGGESSGQTKKKEEKGRETTRSMIVKVITRARALLVKTEGPGDKNTGAKRRDKTNPEGVCINRA